MYFLFHVLIGDKPSICFVVSSMCNQQQRELSSIWSTVYGVWSGSNESETSERGENMMYRGDTCSQGSRTHSDCSFSFNYTFTDMHVDNLSAGPLRAFWLTGVFFHWVSKAIMVLRHPTPSLCSIWRNSIYITNGLEPPNPNTGTAF